MYKQLKIDIFNIKAPIIEEEPKLMKRKQDNKVEVVNNGYAKIIESGKVDFKEDKKEEIKYIKF